MKIIFSFIAVIVGIYGFYPYLKGVLKKETKPHAFTWLIWAITQGTAVVGLWLGGGGVGAISLTIGTIAVVLIFILSLRQGSCDITKSDILVLIIALTAIFIWCFLDNGLLAIVMVSMIDSLGYIPTFRKSYRQPRTEKALTWGCFIVSNIFAILALESYNAMTLTYLVTILSTEIILVSFLLIRRGKVFDKKQGI